MLISAAETVASRMLPLTQPLNKAAVVAASVANDGALALAGSQSSAVQLLASVCAAGAEQDVLGSAVNKPIYNVCPPAMVCYLLSQE